MTRNISSTATRRTRNTRCGPILAARDAGADMVVLCDTNGGSMPEEIERVTAAVVKELGIPVGIHTHNDSGLGVANALAGVRAVRRRCRGRSTGTANGWAIAT